MYISLLLWESFFPPPILSAWMGVCVIDVRVLARAHLSLCLLWKVHIFRLNDDDMSFFFLFLISLRRCCLSFNFPRVRFRGTTRFQIRWHVSENDMIITGKRVCAGRWVLLRHTDIVTQCINWGLMLMRLITLCLKAIFGKAFEQCDFWGVWKLWGNQK